MTTPYTACCGQLAKTPKKWLITGVAGFIGSNLLETLLKLDQEVVGLDNFATGHQRNLDEVQRLITPAQWGRLSFVEGDSFEYIQVLCNRKWRHSTLASMALP